MEEAEQSPILPTITALNEATLGCEWAALCGSAAARTIPGRSTLGRSMETGARPSGTASAENSLFTGRVW